MSAGTAPSAQTPTQSDLFRLLFGLEGRVAIVTGGRWGIGRAIAGTLEAAGASVVTIDHSDDAGDPDEKFDVVEKHGRLDILVNAAVRYHNRPTLEIAAEEWDSVQSLNLKAAFQAIQRAVPQMRRNGGGRIVNVTTIGALHPVLHGNAAYGAARAGLGAVTRSCALEFAPDGITVNSLLPGAIVTDSIDPDFRPTGPGADPARHLLGYGRAGDLDGALLMLTGSAGRYITGQSIVVDGGFMVS